VVRRLR